MGKCESATASIGIKIKLSDLISQINESNFERIKGILMDSIIEDKNDYFNMVYEEITGDDVFLEGNYNDVKKFLMDECKSNGSRDDVYIGHGVLFDKYLLFPIKTILSTARWGYDRYGTNSSSRQIDFDLSVNIESIKDLQNYEIVFIVHQTSS